MPPGWSRRSDRGFSVLNGSIGLGAAVDAAGNAPDAYTSIVIRPRIGKFDPQGASRARLPDHDVPMVVLGSTLPGTDLPISFVVVNTMPPASRRRSPRISRSASRA